MRSTGPAHPTRIIANNDYGGRKRRRRYIFGKDGHLTVAQAREKAQGLLGEVAKGNDPMEDRNVSRAVPTFSEWLVGYLKDVDRRKKSASDDHRFLRWAEKRWGKRPMDKVTTDDVSRAFEARRTNHGKISANRFLASVRA